MNTGNNLLFLVVSALLAFMSVTGMAGTLNLKRLTPHLSPPEELYAGSRAPFGVRLHNGKRFVPSFLIRLECPDGQSRLVPFVPAGGTVTLSMGFLFPRRGTARIERLTISSSFPVNFFTRHWTHRLDESLVVFPRLVPGPAVGDDHGGRQGGDRPRHLRGVDGELERITPYTGREPLKMIHWKLTARGDELLVKEYGRQAARPLIIDLERQPGTTLEERISTAAWLVKRWSPLRPVGLIVDGRVVPAASGRRHLLQLLTELALHGRD